MPDTGGQERGTKQPLLPEVSRATITNSSLFNEEDLMRERKSDAPLFRNLRERPVTEFMGTFTVDRLLKAEAAKQKITLPDVQRDTIDEYNAQQEQKVEAFRKKHGLSDKEPSTMDEMLAAYGLTSEAVKEEGLPEFLSWAKYKGENSELMDYLAINVVGILANAGFSPPEIALFQNGAFHTYELYRLQAEKAQKLK